MTNEYLTCDDCGITSEDVVETTCPFTEEIWGEEVPATLCSKCYQERIYDI